MTTLSVVLPVRDGGPYLRDALTSLERNVDGDTEVIVVDDASVDDTPLVLEEHADLLPTMHVVRHDHAVGLSGARNAGLDHATGRYVTFLDADDWLAPSHLPRLVDAIDTLGCDFVRVDHVQVEARRRTVHRAPHGRRNVVLDPRAAILPHDERTMVDYPYAWAGIYRRDLGDVLRFDDGLHTAEDRPWIWRLHRSADSFAVVSLAGLFYRREVATSLTRIADPRQLHFFDAYRLVFDQVRDEPDILPKAVRQFLALLCHHLELVNTTRPALRQQTTARARDLLASLPIEVLQHAMLEPRRAVLLRPLLPAGVSIRRGRIA